MFWVFSILPYVRCFIVKVAPYLFLSDTISFFYLPNFFSDLLMKNRLLHILYKKKQFSMKSAYLDLQVSMEIFTREKISSEPLSKPIFEDDFLK